ncbi:hypothetical protein [Massilia rhizosphaerae]|uniref:hypothetical protein n=1 Tax=Massilia rhizosphaerae TaxID=2784389 RepID=UPI0018DDAFD8|nr:hypothetical protein [Massilia rhizosphaerae]HWV47158.1 hypothetical protein [Nitrospira sp.]
MIVLPDPTWDSVAVEAIAEKLDKRKRHSWRLQSGKIFFKHRRAEYHLKAARQTVREMVDAMQPAPVTASVEDPVNSSYFGPLTEPLFFHLDGFLEATRSAHDAVMDFLISAEVVPHDSPHSINAFVKRINNTPDRSRTNPVVVAGLLANFWEETGTRAKNYRDCFTHHVTLADPTWSHSVGMVSLGGAWLPHVPWPDNPVADSDAKFNFEGRLDAIAYCADTHEKSDKFLRHLTKQCLVKWDVGAVLENEFVLANVRIGG